MVWVIIGCGNGLSPAQYQDFTWTNDDFLSLGTFGTVLGENLIKIQIRSVKKMHLKILGAKLQPFCLGLDKLNPGDILMVHCFA